MNIRKINPIISKFRIRRVFSRADSYKIDFSFKELWLSLEIESQTCGEHLGFSFTKKKEENKILPSYFSFGTDNLGKIVEIKVRMWISCLSVRLMRSFHFRRTLETEFVSGFHVTVQAGRHVTLHSNTTTPPSSTDEFPRIEIWFSGPSVEKQMKGKPWKSM